MSNVHTLNDIEEELGKQDLKLPDWIDESLKSFVYTLGLENKVKEIEKKIAKEDLLEVLQKALSERNSLIQEAKLKEPNNACLAEQIQKTSSEYEVHGGTRSCLSASDQNEPSSVSKLEKDNDITNLSILPITAGHKVTQAL
ncbi:18978_t:CDS:2, partial [Racocetra fulgida]